MPQAAPLLHRPGDEPLPGYHLLEPLGEGGYGVVWKCRAPGGLNKAIKFVGHGQEGACPATQELAALERVKELRHPFLLSLERVEVLPDGTVVIVMELADASLHELYCDCQDQGLPGVPRDDLLGYLAEAAEALDWMNEQYGLQHLDVKPHNLFLVSGHVKVADFGLVHQLGDGPRRHGGVTPLYSSPEMLRGTLSRHSDQYSLAVVYQQMLTGTVPFWHENIYDLMMQHLSGEPDLAALSEADREVVVRALAKAPEARYASCQAFVAALRGGPPPQLRRSGAWRRVLTGPRPDPTPEAPTQAAPPATLHATPAAASGETPTKRVRAVPAPVGPSRLPGSGLHARARLEPMEASAPGADGPPTSVALPGYRFLSCLAQGPLGDLWRAEDAAGRPKRAVALLPFVRYDARLIAHLKALRDPALPPTEVHWSPAERLVVLTDSYEGTLRDRLERRQAEGHPGVPRGELLGLLRWAAVALDGLQARHGLPHLNVHPRNLLVEGDRLWLAEFGLVPLLWLPTGQSAAALNGRYSAPELLDRRPGRSADQYSLALVYVDMLTGAGPRAGRAGRGEAVDLGLVPATDREVLRRALSAVPAERYGSCTAFIEALEEAGAAPPQAEADLYDTLPAVIPYASLLGEPAGPDAVLPTVPQLVRALTGPALQGLQVLEVPRCFVLPDGSWEHRGPVELPFAGALALKVEGLRAHWGGRLTARGPRSYRLVIDLESPRGFWERPPKKARRLEVDVEATDGARRAEAVVRVRYWGEDGSSGERVLGEMAPKVLASVREYLRAVPEQRSRDRVALGEAVRVYPVLPDLELGEVLQGECRDISAGGVRFVVPRRPQTDYLYLHVYAAAPTLGYALHARVAWVAELAGGVEVGARFEGT